MSSFLEVQLERVAKTIPVLARNDKSSVYNRIERAAAEMVGEKNFRMPNKLTNGWGFGAVDTQGGAVVDGPAPTFFEMTGTFAEFGLGCSLTDRQINVGSSALIASKVNIASMLTDATVEWTAAMDAMMFTNGRPFCFTATNHDATSGVSVYIGDTIIGARRLREGVTVTVYNAAGSTVKDTAYVTSIDYITKTVILSKAVAGGASSDIMTYGTFSGATPVGMNGVPLWNDASTSGALLNVTRLTNSHVRATNVAAASAALTQDMLLLLQDRQRVRSGNNVLESGQEAYMGAGQRSVVQASVQTIQTLEVGGGRPKNVDRVPTMMDGNTFTWAGGMKFNVVLNQSSDRIDVIDFKNFRRLVLKELGFYEVEGKKVHAVINPVTGLPTFKKWMGMYASMQVMNLKPQDGAYISGLAIPANYQ